MKKLIGVILAVMVSGCYTQLQLASKEGPAAPIYDPPDPIIIIIPQPNPCPYPLPHPHPIGIQPPVHTTVPVPVQEENRIRNSGSTRDDNERTQAGERRR